MMLTTPTKPAAQYAASRVGPANALRWSLMVAVGLLAACATPPQQKINRYVSPVGVPVAKLAMRASLTGGADAYGVYVFNDAENCREPQIAGAGRPASTSPASVNLAAGRWATVQFITLHPGGQYCAIRWSFQPAAGRTYLLAGDSVGTTCRAGILDATDPDSIKPVSTAVRRDAPSAACMPLAVAQAARDAKRNGGKGGAGKDEANLRPGASADDLKGLIPQ